MLLIACVNVANLVAGASGRAAQGDRHPRRAGCRATARLLRQFLTESLLLATLAGGSRRVCWRSGAWTWCADSDREVIPRAAEVRVNAWARCCFTLALSLLHRACCSGVIPALHAARGNAGEALQECGLARRGGRRRAAGPGAGGAARRAGGALAGAAHGRRGCCSRACGDCSACRWVSIADGGDHHQPRPCPRSRYSQPAQQADFLRTAWTERLDGVARACAARSGHDGDPAHGREAWASCIYAVIGQPVPPDGKASRWRATMSLPPAISPRWKFRSCAAGRSTSATGRTSPPVVIINQAMARHGFSPDGERGRPETALHRLQPDPHGDRRHRRGRALGEPDRRPAAGPDVFPDVTSATQASS